MSCCGTMARSDFPSEPRADRTAAVPAIADSRKPEIIRFAGGASHVGTRRSEITQDGEGLSRTVTLRPFAAESCLVTNARFAAFVLDTGYLTEAGRFGWGLVFRGLLSETEAVLPSRPSTPWWVMCDGAAWFAPEGPGSRVNDRADHPVVHVSWADARAFTDWAGGRLPTEAEWEHSARGGLDGDPRFPWGERAPDDVGFFPANSWQVEFPERNTRADGWLGTSPVKAFPPNGAGMHDMAGNVWEWMADRFLVHSASRLAERRNEEARAASQKVMKGGSFLCHRSYRYRVAARSGVAADSGASNNGFRVFYDA